MRIINYKKWLTILLSFIFVSPALAENSTSWNSSLTLSAGQSIMTNACTSPWVITGTSCSDNNNIAYRLAYIYNFNRTWGLEISAGELGHAKADGSIASPPAPATAPASYDWHLRATGLAIAGIGTIHLGDSLSLFGKAGVVHAVLKEEWNLAASNGNYYGITLNGVEITDKRAYRFIYGAGIQLDFSKDYALRAQYENFGTYDIYDDYGIPPVSPVKISLLSVGFVLKF